jgi:PAS domain S-box-containing protein
MLITNEKFIITKVNNYIYQRFNYKRGELIGESVDILIETDYKNIIDLREKRFKVSYRSFQEQVNGEVIDKRGKNYPVKMLSGKLEIDTKIIYIFLFNEDDLIPVSPKSVTDTGRGLILN